MASENLALVAGLVVFAVAITVVAFLPAFRGPDAARRDIGTHRLALGAIVAMLLVNGLLTVPLAGVLGDGRRLSLGAFAVAALATQVPMLLVVYVRLILPGAVTWAELGLRPLPVTRVLVVGALTGLAGLVLTAVVGLMMSQLGLRQNQFEQFEFVRNANPLGFAVVLLLAAVSAPFVEEIFFRGFLFGLYRTRQPLWVAYLASGLLFSVAHLAPQLMNPAQMAGLAVGIFALGTLLSWTYQRTGSLYPGMVAHGLNNAIGLTLLYTVQMP